MNLSELKEKALRLKDSAAWKFNEVKTKVLEMKDNSVKKAEEVKSKSTDLKEKALNKAEEANNKVNEIKDKAINKTEEATTKVNELKDKATDLKDKAINKKDETIKKVNDLKEKGEILKDDATKKTDEAVKYSKKKYYTFKFSLQTKEELDFVIAKSATTSVINKETWEEKFYKHKSIVIFAEEWSDFLKKSIYVTPLIITKAFSQNITVKMATSKIEWVDLSEYQVNETELPVMIVFEEEKFYKKIEGEENILKLVKSFNLDINELIENA